MNSKRTAILIGAVVAGVISVLLLVNYVSKLEIDGTQSVPQSQLSNGHVIPKGYTPIADGLAYRCFGEVTVYVTIVDQSYDAYDYTVVTTGGQCEG